MLCILSLFCDVAFRLFSSTIETLIKQSTSEIYVSCPYSILAPKTRFLSKPQWFKPHGPKTLSWSIYVSTEEVADDKRTILNGNTRHKRQKNFNERILLFFWRGEGGGGGVIQDVSTCFKMVYRLSGINIFLMSVLLADLVLLFCLHCFCYCGIWRCYTSQYARAGILLCVKSNIGSQCNYKTKVDFFIRNLPNTWNHTND